MADFDVEAFIAKLDGMGMKLTAIPLADGRFRVSRWCMMKANEHAQQIQDLWTGQIGDDQERIDALAAHLAKLIPNEMARSISSSLPHVASPDIATKADGPCSERTSGPPGAAASLSLHGKPEDICAASRLPKKIVKNSALEPAAARPLPRKRGRGERRGKRESVNPSQPHS